jgi:hypothetical protein
VIRTKTAFVIGAGASRDFGFPLGQELKDILSGLLRLPADHFEAQDQRNEIYWALDQYSAKSGNLRHYITAAWRVSDNMPLAISIDNYLSDHSHNHAAIDVSKIAIAKAILDSERSSVIARNRPNEQVRFANTTGTWLHEFFSIAQEGVPRSVYRTIFDQCAFICFNYDRVIEQFLTEALAQYYDVSRDEATEVIAGLNIVHPYGLVGQFPFSGKAHTAPYGARLGPVELAASAQQIRTFSESVDDGIQQQIQNILISHERVVFLGFGYHKQNMDLLTVAGNRAISRVIGTSMGISGPNFEFVRNDIRSAFPEAASQGGNFIATNSGELLQQYRRLLQY